MLAVDVRRWGGRAVVVVVVEGGGEGGERGGGVVFVAVYKDRTVGANFLNPKHHFSLSPYCAPCPAGIHSLEYFTLALRNCSLLS